MSNQGEQALCNSETKLLENVLLIAREAGQLIMDRYRANAICSQLKDDASPVGEADIIASRYIENALSTISTIPVVSEEALVDYEKRKDWDQMWLVDPLDGTREFINGIDEFTVNIALIRSGTPELGVMYAPALGEMFFAIRGGGAFKEFNGERLQLPCKKLSNKVMAAKGRFHRTELVDSFLKLNEIVDVQTIGSALKFGRLAEGSITIYPRYEKSKEWDTAAGQVIIREADCSIVDLVTTKEPSYNKPSFENHHFIAFSNRLAFEKLQLLS